MKAIAMCGKLVALLLVGSSTLAAATPPARAGGSSAGTAPWVRPLRAMDEALEKGDVRAALRAREDARLAALASPQWEGMVAVGDATLRLARGTGLRLAMEPAARRAYRFALFRARRQGSLDGALRVIEAFAALGDREMARQGFAVAGALAMASHEPQALERVRALEERLSAERRPVGAFLNDGRTSDGGSHGTE